MSWPNVALEKIVKISKGKKHILAEGEAKHRYIQIDDLRNDNLIKYTDDDKGTFVDPKDVIIAWDGANAGTIGYGLKGLIGSTLARLSIVNSDVDTEYLGRFLQSRFKEIRNNCTGATIPHVSKVHLISMEIPLPPLAVQKQIAAVLEKADTLRSQCIKMEQELNTLAQSLFLDMFGDPVTNPKGWDCYALSDLLIGKPQIGTTKPCHSDGIQKNVRVGELGKLEINYDKCSPITLEGNEFKKFKLEQGDYLLARAIGSIDHLGKASIYAEQDVDYVYDSHVMRLRFNEDKMMSHFFYQFMKTNGGRTLFLKSSAQTSVQFNINSKQISGISMPVPPIKLQKKYVEKLDSIFFITNKAIEQKVGFENNFNSLMQRAFKGELELKDVA